MVGQDKGSDRFFDMTSLTFGIHTWGISLGNLKLVIFMYNNGIYLKVLAITLCTSISIWTTNCVVGDVNFVRWSNKASSWLRRTKKDIPHPSWRPRSALQNKLTFRCWNNLIDRNVNFAVPTRLYLIFKSLNYLTKPNGAAESSEFSDLKLNINEYLGADSFHWKNYDCKKGLVWDLTNKHSAP